MKFNDALRQVATEYVGQYLGSDESDGLDEYDKCVHCYLEGMRFGHEDILDPRLVPLRNLANIWVNGGKIEKNELTEAFRSFLEVVCLPSKSKDSQ